MDRAVIIQPIVPPPPIITPSMPVGPQGSKGDPAPQVQIQFSPDGTSWRDGYQNGDMYIRFSVDDGASWTSGIRFVGVDAHPVQIQFSPDGTIWHAGYQDGDMYIRFSADGGASWTPGIRFVATQTQFQFSPDGSAWHEGFQGSDMYIRFSADGGASWTPGVRFVLPPAQAQFSANGTDWHPVYQSGDTYARFSSDGGTSWTSAVPLGASPPSVTFLSKSGCNSIFFLIDGKLYSAAGATDSYAAYTTGVYTSGQAPRLGIYNMHNVNFPEPGDNKIKKVGGGSYYDVAFALFHNGNLYTWGKNYSGSCGLGHTSVVTHPTLAATGVLDVFYHPSQGEYDVNYSAIFVLKSDGLYAAGYNGFGKLGVGNTATQTAFTKCTGLPNNSASDILKVYPIGCNYGFTFVLTSDNRLWFSGRNNTGVAGDGTTTDKTSFADVTSYWVTPGKTLVDIKVSGGSRYYYGTGDSGSQPVAIILLKYSDGTSEAKTCGYNEWGSLGNGTTSNSSTPVLPIGLPRDGSVIDIAGFGSSPMTCQALCSDGRLYAWGYNDYGQVGNGTTANNTPTPVLVATGVTKLFSDGMTSHNYGYYVQSFIQKADGLYMCGYNDAFGYAGMGVNVASNVLTYSKVWLPGDDNHVTDMGHTTNYGGGRALVALTSKGNLYVWGYNGKKQICDNSTNDFPIPQRVPLPRYAK